MSEASETKAASERETTDRCGIEVSRSAQKSPPIAGQHVGLIHHGGEFWHAQSGLIDHLTRLLAGGCGIVLGETEQFTTKTWEDRASAIFLFRNLVKAGLPKIL